MEWISDEAVSLVESLRRSEGLDLWLVGGAELFAFFLNHGLVDDIVLALHPIVLGEGIALFPCQLEPVKLELETVKPYNTGLLVVHYRVIKESA